MSKQDLIERKQYMQQLRNLKGQNIIKVISGVRRCGKSTILHFYSIKIAKLIKIGNFGEFYTLRWYS